MSEIKDLDRVILLEDVIGKDFEANTPIILAKGSIGTVVMEYDGTAFEIEFVDRFGKTYAMETISAEKLSLFEHSPLNLSSC